MSAIKEQGLNAIEDGADGVVRVEDTTGWELDIGVHGGKADERAVGLLAAHIGDAGTPIGSAEAIMARGMWAKNVTDMLNHGDWKFASSALSNMTFHTSWTPGTAADAPAEAGDGQAQPAREASGQGGVDSMILDMLGSGGLGGMPAPAPEQGRPAPETDTETPAAPVQGQEPSVQGQGRPSPETSQEASGQTGGTPVPEHGAAAGEQATTDAVDDADAPGPDDADVPESDGDGPEAQKDPGADDGQNRSAHFTLNDPKGDSGHDPLTRIQGALFGDDRTEKPSRARRRKDGGKPGAAGEAQAAPDGTPAAGGWAREIADQLYIANLEHLGMLSEHAYMNGAMKEIIPAPGVDVSRLRSILGGAGEPARVAVRKRGSRLSVDALLVMDLTSNEASRYRVDETAGIWNAAAKRDSDRGVKYSHSENRWTLTGSIAPFNPFTGITFNNDVALADLQAQMDHYLAYYDLRVDRWIGPSRVVLRRAGTWDADQRGVRSVDAQTDQDQGQED